MDKPLFLTLSEADEARFWKLVDRRGGDDCWPWTGPIDKHGGGYPAGFYLKGYRWRSSHVSLFTKGEARPGQRYESLHSCDNPPCCNPNHLRWGTSEENANERIERQAKKRLAKKLISHT